MRKQKPRIWLQPPRLKWEFIRERAEEFRKKYVDPVDMVPVPIIDIVEFNLKIEIIPIHSLMEKIDIDGFLTSNLKNICIDYDIYMDPRQEKRLRFTYAHEVGHLILHKKEINECDFRTPEDWIHFREDFLEDDLNWFEQQAHEFAGRLLVPKDELKKEIHKFRAGINKVKSRVDEEDLIEAISRRISDRFKVSYHVIQKRIRKDNIWKELKL
jgi:Zn-dependent peptidase ImmA (M78 family)